MTDTIGTILPLAVGIAISPLPLIAAILMLLSPRARVTSGGFLLGWIVGIAVATTIFTLASSAIPPSDGDDASPLLGTIQLLLGALLIFLAARNWRSRAAAGEAAPLPGWMRAIDSFTFVKATGLAFVLAAVNPKNLLLAASAGLTIGSADQSAAESAVTLVVFTLVAASTVILPVVGYLVSANALRPKLEALRVWLERENAVIMAVLLLVLGVVLIGKGIAAL